MEETRNTKEAPKKFIDHNASWPVTIICLGFLIGVYFGQMASIKMFGGNFNNVAYYFISIIVGIVGSFFVYNLGKLVGSKIAHYDLVYIIIAGLTFDFTGSKMKCSFAIGDVFTLRMEFSPKDENVDANPKPLFFGGIVAEAILIVLMLVLFFVFGLSSTQTGSYYFAWGFLFAVCYGFLTPLYELMPLRQDYPTDMFNNIITSDVNERKAYNICKINNRREILGLDYIVPEFDSYDGYYRAHTLYYVYLKNLYEAKLQKASSVIEDMKYFNKYFDEGDRYLIPAEVVYLKYLVDDCEGARKAYLSIKHDDRKAVVSPSLLSLYRTAIYILVDIHSDKEAVTALVKSFDDTVASYGEQHSYRVEKEINFFNTAYNKARKLKPDFELPER